VIEPDTGPKATRAKKLQSLVNLGNVRMVSDDWEPDIEAVRARRWRYAEETGDWNWQTREEYRQFREDEEHEHDDIVDADADAVNELEIRQRVAGGASA